MRFATHLACLLVASTGLACSGPTGQELRNTLQTTLTSAEQAEKVLPFYEERHFKPVWTSPDGLTGSGEDLIALLSDAERLGLPGYRLKAIHDGYRAAYAEDGGDADGRLTAMAQLELDLSAAVVEMTSDVLHGRSQLPKIHRNWHYRVERNSLEPDVLLARFVEEDPLEALDSLRADHPGYMRLREALERYHEIAADGGWEPIEIEPGLSPDADDPRLEAVRERLAATGDLEGDLRDGLERFRARHGLEPSDTIDAATIEALNVPVERRIEQLEINLERQRWLPSRDEDDRVVVNIPEFKLHGYRDGEHAVEMAVIVGKQASQTPIFADEMTHVTFRPYWHVPESIMLGEILPKLKENDDYLEEKGYEVVDSDGEVVKTPRASKLERKIRDGELRIRQRSGPSNALGLVKFMFPNQFAVYLHDTPSDHLFAENERDFSHGCVRVEDPPRLGEFVLKLDRETIEAKLEDPEVVAEEVTLDEPLPVYIVYLTAWVDHDGVLQFRDDIYGHDRAVREELEDEAYTVAELAEFEELRDLIKAN